jgi:HD-GYP domain-containing protein (c-di-GMP phosphodiesterase class II)
MNVAEIDFDEGILMPIGIETMCAAHVLPFDLYLPGKRRRRLVLYRQRKQPIGEADLQRLMQRGVQTLYIAQGDSATYRKYLRDNILKNDDIPAVQRYQILCEAMRAVLSEALTKGDHESAVKVASDFSEGMVQTVCDSQIVLNDLLPIMSHDGSVFTHAANVAASSLLLAQRLGIKEKRELLRIGQGALLHDVGEQGLPRQIMEKPGKVTDRERRIVREHPLRGFKGLCRREDLTWGQLMMVYQHHERFDGRGYPQGLVGKEIHEWARLCAVADVYDALTRDRSYRKGADTKEVVEYMDRESRRSFDKEICQCWIATLKQCPQ